MPERQTTIGVKLYKGATRTAITTQVTGLKSFPDMMGTPDKIETTTQEDTQRKYRPGLKDPGDMQFVFAYEGQGPSTNWGIMRADETAGNSPWWKLLFPDGSGFIWQGGVSLSLSGKGVAEAVEFNANIAPSSDITPLGELGAIKVTAAASSTAGSAVITTDPATVEGMTAKYKTAADAALPAYGDVCTTGWTAFTSGEDYSVTAGNYFVVVLLDSDSKAVYAGIHTIGAAEIGD